MYHYNVEQILNIILTFQKKQYLAYLTFDMPMYLIQLESHLHWLARGLYIWIKSICCKCVSFEDDNLIMSVEQLPGLSTVYLIFLTIMSYKNWWDSFRIIFIYSSIVLVAHPIQRSLTWHILELLVVLGLASCWLYSSVVVSIIKWITNMIQCIFNSSLYLLKRMCCVVLFWYFCIIKDYTHTYVNLLQL